MPGARCARSRVWCVEAHALVTTVTPESPGIPRAMVCNGFTAYIALSRVTGLSCHPRRRSCLHQLDASVGASGPHDFAVRRSSAVRQRAVDGSRENPPCHHLARPALPRPPHLEPYVRDDRDTPLMWAETAWIYD